jgi:hypothetical protein
MYNKVGSKITQNGRKQTIFSKFMNETKVSALTTLIQYIARNLIQNWKRRERNKRDANRTARTEIMPFCR